MIERSVALEVLSKMEAWFLGFRAGSETPWQRDDADRMLERIEALREFVRGARPRDEGSEVLQSSG
jgi:hypothetical protein